MESRTSTHPDKTSTNAGSLITGIDLAVNLKYYFQFKRTTIRTPIAMNRISGKTFYLQHKTALDNLAVVLNKYKMNADKFCKFFVIDFNKTERDINDSLVSTYTFNEYVQHLTKIKKRNDIYSWVMKSVKTIANECYQLNIMSTKDFIRKLISDKRLAAYYISGKISKYYLAAIPNFNKVIPKLDHFSKLDLDDLYRLFDVYQTEVQDAFLYMKNIKINPLRLTDTMIAKIRQRQLENV